MRKPPFLDCRQDGSCIPMSRSWLAQLRNLASSDLNALVPILSSQLTLAGGLKLPGRMRKWSSLDPPEVRAVVQDADSIAVWMTRLEDGDGPIGTPRTWTSQEPALVVDLGAERLPDGDYELSLVSKKKVVQHTMLRLRSSIHQTESAGRQLRGWYTTLTKTRSRLSRAAPAAEHAAKTARMRPICTPPTVHPARRRLWHRALCWWDAPKPRVGPSLTPIAIALSRPNVLRGHRSASDQASDVLRSSDLGHGDRRMREMRAREALSRPLLGAAIRGMVQCAPEAGHGADSGCQPPSRDQAPRR